MREGEHARGACVTRSACAVAVCPPPAPCAALATCTLLACVLLACAALLGTPSTASASDAGATQSYLEANLALVRVADAHLRNSEAAPVRILEGVRRECPGAGAGSPENADSTQMSDAVIGAMVLDAARPDMPQIRAFVRTASSLRWSGASVTADVHAYVAKLRTLLALSAPNLCAEVRSWGADGFTALPAATVSFVGRFMPAWVALGYVPHALAAYETASSRALAGAAARVENLLTEAEARAVVHWGNIMETLELNP